MVGLTPKLSRGPRSDDFGWSALLGLDGEMLCNVVPFLCDFEYLPIAASLNQQVIIKQLF